MYAQYKSHNDATMSHMENAMHLCYNFKDVCEGRRAGKKDKPNTNALRTELVKKRKVHEKTNGESWIPTKTRPNEMSGGIISPMK